MYRTSRPPPLPQRMGARSVTPRIAVSMPAPSGTRVIKPIPLTTGSGHKVSLQPSKPASIALTPKPFSSQRAPGVPVSVAPAKPAVADPDQFPRSGPHYGQSFPEHSVVEFSNTKRNVATFRSSYPTIPLPYEFVGLEFPPAEKTDAMGIPFPVPTVVSLDTDTSGVLTTAVDAAKPVDGAVHTVRLLGCTGADMTKDESCHLSNRIHFLCQKPVGAGNVQFIGGHWKEEDGEPTLAKGLSAALVRLVQQQVGMDLKGTTFHLFAHLEYTRREYVEHVYFLLPEWWGSTVLARRQHRLQPRKTRKWVKEQLPTTEAEQKRFAAAHEAKITATRAAAERIRPGEKEAVRATRLAEMEEAVALLIRNRPEPPQEKTVQKTVEVTEDDERVVMSPVLLSLRLMLEVSQYKQSAIPLLIETRGELRLIATLFDEMLRHKFISEASGWLGEYINRKSTLDEERKTIEGRVVEASKKRKAALDLRASKRRRLDERTRELEREKRVGKLKKATEKEWETTEREQLEQEKERKLQADIEADKNEVDDEAPPPTPGKWEVHQEEASKFSYFDNSLGTPSGVVDRDTLVIALLGKGTSFGTLDSFMEPLGLAAGADGKKHRRGQWNYHHACQRYQEAAPPAVEEKTENKKEETDMKED